MKTLVVAATIDEVRGVYLHFGLSESRFAEANGFDILITGVGMTATAFALGRQLQAGYKQVLNLGIAGAFDRNIALGDLVYVTSDLFSELGAENGTEFISIDALGFGSARVETNAVINPRLNGLRKGNGITVNTVHGERESIEKVIQRFNPMVESMEGAAVLYACAQYKIPAIQVRSISNYVETRNRDNWKIGLAIKNLNDWAIAFLTNP
jgi:futalosine hydrolase